MMGAAATAFYINDVATVLPKSVVAKTSAFLAGAAADVLEVNKGGWGYGFKKNIKEHFIKKHF